VTLTIASEDGTLLVCYVLTQRDDARHVTVLLGVRFGVPCPPGPWRRFRSPRFGTDTSIAPGEVARFIRWCLTPADDRIEVDYRGVSIP